MGGLLSELDLITMMTEDFCAFIFWSFSWRIIVFCPFPFGGFLSFLDGRRLDLGVMTATSIYLGGFRDTALAAIHTYDILEQAAFAFITSADRLRQTHTKTNTHTDKHTLTLRSAS